MKPTVLLFGISPAKRNAIGVICHKLNLRMVEVPPQRWGCTMETLFAGTEGECPAKEPFDEEMLVMDLPGAVMDFFLQGLRRQKVAVDLKAARTPTNDTWTADALYQELCREREAFRNGTAAPHQ